jgi:hypothetical protein
MLKDSNINLIMDKLYGEDEENLDLSLEDQKELDDLQSQLSFLDDWDLENDLVKVSKPEKEQSDVLNIKEVADYLQLSETEIVSLLPEIPHVCLAGKYRFQLDSIKKWLRSVEKNKVVLQHNSTKTDNIVNFQDFLVRNVI